MTARLRALWRASNHRGLNVFGSGKVSSLVSSKAIFVEMAHDREFEGLHLALPPTNHEMHQLDEDHLASISLELQPKFLDFRLRNLDKMRTFSTRDHDSTYPGTQLARDLAACVLGEPEVMELIAPLLRRLERDSIAERSSDVHLAMIEVAWAPSHTEPEVSISRLSDLTNSLLRSRGETLEYSAAELGWKLRNFGFRRHRTGNGMVLQFSQENRSLLHQLAARLGLIVRPVPGCVLCSSRETVGAKTLM
jgi:hypothetical protein